MKMEEAVPEMDKLIEVTLIVDYVNPLQGSQVRPALVEEKFSFSHKECNRDLNTLINMICQMKGIIRADDIRIVLTPDFIVMDIDCIENNDKIIMKSINKVMPLVHYREL
jgi:hypothetical protein